MERVFAENLRRLRKSRGYKTQEDVSAAAGIPYRTYQDLERGLHLPKGATLVRLAHALNVSEAAFFAPQAEEMASPPTDEALALVQRALKLLERIPSDVIDRLAEMGPDDVAWLRGALTGRLPDDKGGGKGQKG